MEDRTKNRPSSLLEFGPGRGTLMKDVIRVLIEFGVFRDIEINFVEASPFLMKEQQERMKNMLKEKDLWLAYKEKHQNQIDLGSIEESMTKNDKFTKCETLYSQENGITLNWYQTYEAYLAHHQEAFKKDKGNPILR